MADRRPSPLAFAGLVALLVAYLFTVPLAARKDGDLAHLWVGGRALVEAGPAGIYDPALHRSLLSRTLQGPVPDALWASRNDELGAFFYPPPTALLYAPLSLLPLRTAALVHAVLVVLAAIGSAGLLVRLLDRRLGIAAALALLLLFPSTFFGFVLGQNGIFTLLLLLGGGLLHLRGQPLAGGLLLGLLAFKPSWWIAFALVGPGALRSGRLLLGMVLGAAAFALLGLLLLGPSPYLVFLDLAPRIARLEQLPDYPLHLQHDLVGLFRRFFGLRIGGMIGWGAALVVLGLTIRGVRGQPPQAAFALACTAAVLVNPHVHHYDLLPALVGLGALISWGRDGSRRAQLGLGLVVLLHHLAFVAEGLAGIGARVSLPTLATILVWGLLLSKRVA